MSQGWFISQNNYRHGIPIHLTWLNLQGEQVLRVSAGTRILSLDNELRDGQ